MELVKFIGSVLIGGGVVYGVVVTEIKVMKQQLNDSKRHGERLAAIEAKIDLLINKKS